MTDFLDSNHFLNAGRPGVVAKRSANLIIQKSDFILSLGSRLDRIVTAFNPIILEEMLNIFIQLILIKMN